MLTQEYLKTRLRYDPDTGLFVWIGVYSDGRKASGKRLAGSLRDDGYIEIRVDGKAYRASQLAWLYMTGEFTSLVEHQDRVRTNNKWANLRKATHSQNACNRPKQSNNTSGYKGVFWNTRVGKWQAKISVQGHQYHLGFHGTPEAAYAAYLTAVVTHHGEFACA